MTATLHAYPGQEAPAGRLADALGIAMGRIGIHNFPDGESLVTVAETAPTALVYCTLDRPNAKLIELALAADALRGRGARRLVLVAPYLCYMRQDRAFNAGEAVSQRAVGRLIAGLFDRVMTVDPHLHRTASLAAVFPGIAADALSATGLIADLLREENVAPDTIIVGPDAESRQWAQAIARPLGLDLMVGDKRRHGDRAVCVTLAGAAAVAGRPAIIVDDMVSTGATVAAVADQLAAAGAAAIELLTVHALYDAAVPCAGLARVRSSDSAAHPSNAFALAPLMARALMNEVAP